MPKSDNKPEVTTAILVDGGFFLKRAKTLWGDASPEKRAKELFTYCLEHLKCKDEYRRLYRIFYYDCRPLSNQQYHPLTNRTYSMSKTPLYAWMNTFHSELLNKRKVALRFGEIAQAQAEYVLKQDSTKKLCRKKITIDDLTEDDFKLNAPQKGVDMRIGLDIASLSYKKQVDQIILVSDDSDFVPAAKLARREGIDFILDPMGAKMKANLFEHIDGVETPRIYFKSTVTENQEN